MEIFKPPTDNLYKFMAIAGLLIIAVSVIYPSSKFYQLKTDLIEVQSDAALHEALKTKPQGQSTVTTTNQSPSALVETNLMVRSEIEAENEITKKINKLRLNANLMNYYSIMLGVGVGLGTILAWNGFFLWHRKVQVYQDAILKKQAEEFIPNLEEVLKKPKSKSKK